MKIEFSKGLKKELHVLKIRQPELAKLIQKKISIFQSDPKHPSLRIHKLTGKMNDLWSLSIDNSRRLIYIMKEGAVEFVDFGTHDEVYR